MRALITSIMIVVGALSVAAQKSSPPPGAIQLPDGFRHVRYRGIDTQVGRIVKEGGLEIRYDIGGLAGNGAAGVKEDDRKWTIKQVINGEPVQIVKSKDGSVVVTFTGMGANFWAKVSNEEE